ncbi:MAG: pseudaminic acid cytidylyltransferase [Sphingobacteriaceae bacterium]
MGGNLAIIPARGGSKRIPRKNIKDFLGKPIIAYSIDLALKSGLFDEVMVSTDDEEIARIAQDYGAAVPFFRSEINADDFATTISVLKEVELFYLQKRKRTFDYICCIYPTAPLIQIQHLQEGFDLMKKNELDAVFPVVAFSYPIWRGLEVVDGKTKMVWPEYSKSRSQDLTAVYHDAGQWCWYDPKKVTNEILTDDVSSVILNEVEVQDIDTLTDWNLAELKFRILNGN